MKETDIRPSELIKGQEKAFQHDTDRLLKHIKEFVKVNCPACDKYDKWARTVTYRKDFRFVECEYCGTAYLNPRPTPQLLEGYYKNSEHYKYWASKIFPQTEAKRREQIFKPRAKRVMELSMQYGKWGTPEALFDIGAGYGTFCEEVILLNYFRYVVAIEPTPELAEQCRLSCIDTCETPIEEIQGTNAEVITAFELIEHLYSPQDFIKKCYEILSPKGLLILTCPNVQGFDIAVLKENSDQFNPEHLNYFNPKSLSLLLENNGFEVLEISTPGKLDVDIVKNKVAQKKYTPEPFIQKLLDTGDKFQQFLVDNNLSSHLWLVGRKK